MDWASVFLAFRGRLSSSRFRQGTSILDRLCYIPIAFSLLWRPDPTPNEYWLVIHVAILVLELAAIWPWLAITTKRLHDSERSILLAIPIALTLPLVMVFVIAYDLDVIAPPMFYPAIGVAVLLITGQILLESKIGNFPGISGPNRFGPEQID